MYISKQSSVNMNQPSIWAAAARLTSLLIREIERKCIPKQIMNYYYLATLAIQVSIKVKVACNYSLMSLIFKNICAVLKLTG